MSIKQPDAERFALLLVDRYGLDLTGTAGEDSEGVYVDFRLKELHPNEGFAVRVRFGWRSISAEFIPGKWAAGLLLEMGNAGSAKQEVFNELAEAIAAVGGQVSLLVNDLKCDPFDATAWPAEWKQLLLSIQRGPVIVDMTNSAAVEKAVVIWGGSLLGMIVSLLPIEEAEKVVEPEIEGLPEGAKTRIDVNRYERSRLNRAMCISIHGNHCATCGFAFEKKYGSLGEDFIHVHHVTPVSKMGEGYVVNPASDLVPLCPNCHAMIHREDPPLSLDELRAVIEMTANKNGHGRK
jgi:5-methylcytosine-specific restriction enzyme A